MPFSPESTVDRSVTQIIINPGKMLKRLTLIKNCRLVKDHYTIDLSYTRAKPRLKIIELYKFAFTETVVGSITIF
jgi:hypothetical protein